MKRKDCGHGSRKLFKALLACSLLLFLVAQPLAAWVMPQEKEEIITVAAVTDTMEKKETEAAPLQSKPSGTALKDTSEEPSKSLEKAEEGKRLSGNEALELYLVLTEASEEAAAARAASEAKDDEIAELKAQLAKAESEAGSKPYLMIDSIVGIENAIPQYGVGLTVGSRIGNSLMVEIGADYMIGGNDGYNVFDLDNFQFRAGAGWMF